MATHGKTTVGSAEPSTPHWMRESEAVTLYVEDHGYVQGTLMQDQEEEWQFVSRDAFFNNQRLIIDLPDLPIIYHKRMHENSFLPVWPPNPGVLLTARAHMVSATGLKSPIALTFIARLTQMSAPDQKTWLAAYMEEYDSLKRMGVFDEIDEAMYQTYLAQGYHAIPTMNIFTVKPNKMGNPYCEKSRIVVLGNLEERVWSNTDRYAPVLQSSSGQLLIAMAVERGQIAKQGDCKNAFCQPALPAEEIVICQPPPGCPVTGPNKYWLLRKTLYGLKRSPRHWYEKFVAVLVDKLHFHHCNNDPCVLWTQPTPGGEKIYIGVYDDNFVYFSASDSIEQWFETELAKHLTVDFMGAVDYFLGCRYQWFCTANGLGVHISQPGYIEQS